MVGRTHIYVAVLCLVWMARTNGTVRYATPDGGAAALCACIEASVRPGDACLLRAGTYEVGATTCALDGARGTASEPIVIGAAGDGPVVLDGTIVVNGPWERVAAAAGVASPHAVSAASPAGADLLQLFVDGEQQVLARFPNARWSDKSVFYAVANWFRSRNGTHDLATGVGTLRDQGACAGADEACCSKCNTHDLAKSGVNATGALAVLNLWSCDTGVQRITAHDAASPGTLHYAATWEGLCDDYRGGDGRYFLEGTRALLDAPEEWLFDAVAKRVLLPAPPAPGAEVRGRVSEYALVATNSSFVTFANLSFRATTMAANGDVANIALRGLVFNYSATSRRSLGDSAPPIALSVWRAREADAPGAPANPANFLIDDVAVRYSDGPALMVNGVGTTIRDSLFEWNDFTAVGGSWPVGVVHGRGDGKAHRATTVWAADCDYLVVERCSFRNNGAAQSITAGGTNHVPARVTACDFQSQLSLQDDGAFVEGGGRPSTAFVQNWCSGTGKAALRWDGYFADNVTGGVMLRNVAWNTSMLVIKGDRHNVTANTVFDAADIGPTHAAHDRPRFQDHSSPLNNLTAKQPHASAGVGAGTKAWDPRADNLTVFARNVFDSVVEMGAKCPTAPHCTPPGQYHADNLIGTATPFDLRAELRAPYHKDFRPCPNSTVARTGAGAYAPYDPHSATYFIPGRRERSTATTPVPPSGAIGVHLNTELMFLPAVLAAGHDIFFGRAGGSGSAPPLQPLATLAGASANIARPAALAALLPHTAYAWRVDTRTAAGGVVRGATWTLTTGAGRACEITPHPPPHPPHPGPGPTPAGCIAAEGKCCPALGGTGAQKGGACYNCVKAHDMALEAAGCYAAGGGGRHAFVQKFCGKTTEIE
eukprot:g3802.t1